MILDTSLTDAAEAVLFRLSARLESWQCHIPTLFIFFVPVVLYAAIKAEN